MNYQMHFDPYLTEHLNQPHEELLQEMEGLRLEKRLREDKERTSHLYAFSVRLWSALHPLRRTGLAGH